MPLFVCKVQKAFPLQLSTLSVEGERWYDYVHGTCYHILCTVS